MKQSAVFSSFLFASVIFTALLMNSCGRKYLFDDIHAINKDGWTAKQKERFVFNVPDTNNTYFFYMQVRHDIEYRYSNLYLFVETQFPNGNITRDTLECILAEPNGKWTGKGYGRLKENLIMLNPTIKFPLKGDYTIDIEQGMRDENLKGITDIGIRIEPNKR
ncbi:MAG TPA: gliding motility lipoprotein GldH [Bacteroidales bacterium]|nr:gliding motility lipoprotein GldH [Bacteroidales bacterium]HQQ11612.1 gliding motility lipoprotein GldH [Bacteroidales bacterium]